jgi:predicted dehydrogenase
MTAVAAELVAAGVPFTIEKPAGLDWRELEAVAEEAEAAGLFAAVSLVARTYPLARRCRELLEAGELGEPTHYYYRLFAGEPSRYREWHVPWMLQPERAGAGCLFNFGPHVIDLVHYLTGQSIAEVFCRLSDLTHGQPIPDLACLVMRTEGGALATAEVSYTMPTAYERYFSFTSTALHCSGDLDSGTLFFRDGREESLAAEPDDWALRYVRDTLRRVKAGERPLATLSDMARTLRVMNAAVASNAARQAVELGLA